MYSVPSLNIPVEMLIWEKSKGHEFDFVEFWTFK